MPQELSQLIDQLLEAWNSHDVEQVVDCYAQSFQGRDVGEPEEQIGKDGVRQSFGRYLNAFPDIRFSKQDQVLDGNRVALSWKAHGTHLGYLMNIPPTGRRVEVSGMSMLTIDGGFITNALYIWDVAGLLRAINLLPEL